MSTYRIHEDIFDLYAGSAPGEQVSAARRRGQAAALPCRPPSGVWQGLGETYVNIHITMTIHLTMNITIHT